MTRMQKISLAEWAIVGAILLLDAVLAAITGVPAKVPVNTVLELAIITGLWPLTFLLIRTTGFAKGAEIIPENAAKFFIFIVVACPLEYYAAMSPLPLNDEKLVWADRMLGFDWLAFYQWVMHHNWAYRILNFCYFALMYEAAAVLFFVGAFYPGRACRFPTALIVSGLIAIAFLGLFPVAGPCQQFGRMDLPSTMHLPQYLALRAHTMTFIPMDNLRGLICFPSFHVSSAVIMSYFLRRIPVLFPLSILLNIGMGIGALPIGGHYLTDVLAGIVLGLVTILVIAKLEGKTPEKPLPLMRARK